MKKIRMGIVGLGQRGQGMLQTFLAYSIVDVVAVCDVYQDRVDLVSQKVEEQRGHKPRQYLDFSMMLKDKEMDAIYIASSWEEHIKQAILAMKAHIPVALEVGGAYDVKDCWELVRTYEQSKTPIMMMENCCYDRFETLITSLTREGMLGEIIYCHGSYSHDLRSEITGGNINRHYRLRNYINRNCENYPTHELGPIARLLNINRGNRFVSIVSIASKSRGLEEYVKSGRCKDKSLEGVNFKQGDVVNTIITCENGETITITLDTTLPGFYSRNMRVKGTKGCALQEPNMVLLDDDHEDIWNTTESIKRYLNSAQKYNEYLPKYWRDITQEQINLGHGGMDFYMIGAFIDALINHKPMPIDVYDCAAWYVITPLSAKSIANGGRVYKIPDFTKGKYKTNKQVDPFDKEASYEKYY